MLSWTVRLNGVIFRLRAPSPNLCRANCEAWMFCPSRAYSRSPRLDTACLLALGCISPSESRQLGLALGEFSCLLNWRFSRLIVEFPLSIVPPSMVGVSNSGQELSAQQALARGRG